MHISQRTASTYYPTRMHIFQRTASTYYFTMNAHFRGKVNRIIWQFTFTRPREIFSGNIFTSNIPHSYHFQSPNTPHIYVSFNIILLTPFRSSCLILVLECRRRGLLNSSHLIARIFGCWCRRRKRDVMWTLFNVLQF